MRVFPIHWVPQQVQGKVVAKREMFLCFIVSVKNPAQVNTPPTLKKCYHALATDIYQAPGNLRSTITLLYFALPLLLDRYPARADRDLHSLHDLVVIRHATYVRYSYVERFYMR